MTSNLSEDISSFKKTVNNPTNVAWDFKCELSYNSLLISVQKLNSFEYYQKEKEYDQIKKYEDLKKMFNDLQNLIEDDFKIEFKEKNNELILLMNNQNDKDNKIILPQIWNNNNGQILWDKYMSILNKKNQLEEENNELKKENEKIKKQNLELLKKNEYNYEKIIDNTITPDDNENKKNSSLIHLGINIGASKTVYSIFQKKMINIFLMYF